MTASAMPLADTYAARESRQLIAAVANQQSSPSFAGRCMYCAARCYGRACPSHQDLLALEQQMFRGPVRQAA